MIKLRAVVFLLLLHHLVVHANDNLKFGLLSPSDGLAGNYITSLDVDNNGMLWIASTMGLNWYDGYAMHTLGLPCVNGICNSDIMIMALKSDIEGNIWLATTQDVFVYQQESETFKHLNINEKDKKNTVVNYIFVDRKNEKWALTDNGLYRYNKPRGKFEKQLLGTFTDCRLLKMDADKDGNFWILHEKGLLQWNRKTSNIINYVNKKDDANSISPMNLNGDVLVDHQNNIWIGTPSALNKWNRRTRSFEKYNFIGGIIDIEEGPNKTLWVSTWEDGLYNFEPETGNFKKYLYNPNLQKSLATNSLTSLVVDKNNILWIGTGGGGLNIYNPLSINFNTYRHIAESHKSLNNEIVRTFFEDNDNIWVGTENGGINVFDPEKESFGLIQSAQQHTRLSNNMILAVCKDDQDIIWIGTLAGLNKYDKLKHKYALFEPKSNQLFNDSRQIWSMAKTPDGLIWMGTNRGLVKFNPRTTEVEFIQKDARGLTDDRIPYLLVDNDGTLWIGTKNGLNHYNTQTGKFETFVNNKNNAYSLVSNTINYIHQSEDGTIWIGTTGGLSKFERKTHRFSNYTTGNGLPGNVICGILEDEKRNLWVSCTNGLFMLNPYSNVIKTFNLNDGLQGNMFMAGSCLKSKKNGTMYFGGDMGFSSFLPSRIIENKIPPTVLITGLKINNKEIKQGDPHSPLQKNIRYTKGLKLTFSQNTFSFDFIGVNLVCPDKNQYAYKLIGFDKDWVNCQNRRSAFYTNVPYGKYRFRVKASNNDGVWSDKGAEISVTILPPLWATWWARILYIFIPLVLLYFFRKYSLIAVEAKNELKVSRIEKEKIKELYDMKMRFFMNISHEFRTPLTLIIDPLENVLKQLPDNSSIRPTLLLTRKNAGKLLLLINQLLEFRKIETGTMTLQVSENDIVRFTNEIIETFKERFDRKNIRLELKSNPADISVWFDADKFEKILSNLLSNAYKFTNENGRVSIFISLENRIVGSQGRFNKIFGKDKSEVLEFVKIVVEDTGVGINKEAQAKVFERFYQVAQQNNYVIQGTGIGLSLTRELVLLHKGFIDLYSEPNIGSKFTVYLPLGKKHFDKNTLIESGNAHSSHGTPSHVLGSNFDSAIQINEKEDTIKTKHKNIVLIIDDNKDITSYIEINLKNNYEVKTCKNGIEGLAMAQRLIPDLILSDVMMPEMDGVEMTRQLRQDETTCHIPIILLTARAAKEAEYEALLAGANDYITKPFNIQLLEVKIKNTLELRAQMQRKNKLTLTSPTIDIAYESIDDKFLKKLNKLVEANISNSEFEVEHIVHDLSISRAQLYRKLDSLTGQSVKEFVRNVRLRSAARLLAKGDLRIMEVMTMVGINNRAYFIKCFKEQYGVTPSDYKPSSANES